MRTLLNIEDFEADYKKFYKGDLDNLNFDEVLREVIEGENIYELKRHESNTGYGKTFFFDEEITCIDEENKVVATYTGHGNH